VHELCNGILAQDFNNASDWPAGAFGLRQKRFYMGEEGDPDVPFLIVTHFPPNVVTPRHSHDGVFLDAVVQGSSHIGGEWCPAGTVRWFPAEAMYGPVKAGPEGCILLEFYLSAAGFKVNVDEEALTDEMKAEIGRLST
jgi:hypothetical protein